MSTKIEDRLKEARIKKLMNGAIEYNGEFRSIDELCDNMSRASFEEEKAVKAFYNGKEFVVSERSNSEKVACAWCDQVLKVGKQSSEQTSDQLEVYKSLGKFNTKPNLSISSEIMYLKNVEAMFRKDPDKLDTIQLMDLYVAKKIDAYEGIDSEEIKPAIKESMKKYMEGEKTFDTSSLYNISRLSNLKGFMQETKMYPVAEIDKKLGETKLEMVEGIDLKGIEHSSKSLSFVMNVARECEGSKESQDKYMACYAKLNEITNSVNSLNR